MVEKAVAPRHRTRNAICTIAGCGRPHRARGYCAGHWARWRKDGHPGGPIQVYVPVVCVVDGCANIAESRFKGHGPFCNKHFLRMFHAGSTELVPQVRKTQKICSAPGCNKPSRTIGGKWCEMHYMRLRNNGTLERKQRRSFGVTQAGYVWVRQPDHPLANGARVMLHRKVLFDEIGPGPHRCRWCGRRVEWGGIKDGALVVDHVDGDRQNNDRPNLVPACNPCNTARSWFMHWASIHADDPFMHLLFKSAQSGRPPRLI